MSAVPVLKEELDRKSFEAIEWLVHSLETGRISAAQYSTGVDALFKAVNGLVDEGINEIITLASPLTTPLHRERSVLVLNAHIVVIEWVAGRDTVSITGYSSGAQTAEKIKDCDTPELARAAFKKLVDHYVGKGYSII